VKIIDLFFNESQVVSGIIRLMRKCLQIIDNDNPNVIDYDQITSIQPDKLSKNFKVKNNYLYINFRKY
jgi:hypothetical protein